MEIALFNENGKPTAYIADDGETIYLWDGRPVAYVSEDKVFDWNGRQLGWFNNGTIFDIYGLRSGFIKSKSPIATEMEPLKPQKTPEAGHRGKPDPRLETGFVLWVLQQEFGGPFGGRRPTLIVA